MPPKDPSTQKLHFHILGVSGTPLTGYTTRMYVCLCTILATRYPHEQRPWHSSIASYALNGEPASRTACQAERVLRNHHDCAGRGTGADVASNSQDCQDSALASAALPGLSGMPRLPWPRCSLGGGPVCTGIWRDRSWRSAHRSDTPTMRAPEACGSTC